MISTSMLKASDGFSKLISSLAFIIGMGIFFYTLAQAVMLMPLNLAYAIGSGLGMVLTALIAVLIWKEPVNLYTAGGIALIVSGVVLLNLK